MNKGKSYQISWAEGNTLCLAGRDPRGTGDQESYELKDRPGTAASAGLRPTGAGTTEPKPLPTTRSEGETCYISQTDADQDVSP